MTRENLSSGFQQSEIETSMLSYRDQLKIEISLEACLDMILSNTQITKVLIRLLWSVPMLFANPKDRFLTLRPILNPVILLLEFIICIASGNEIMPCNKIDKPLVVYRLTGNVITSITMLRT